MHLFPGETEQAPLTIIKTLALEFSTALSQSLSVANEGDGHEGWVRDGSVGLYSAQLLSCER